MTSNATKTAHEIPVSDASEVAKAEHDIKDDVSEPSKPTISKRMVWN